MNTNTENKPNITDTVVTGTITNIVEYGAFVDLGDSQTGLLHVSELPGNCRDERDACLAGLKLGAAVTVKVIGCERKGSRTRYSLSLRAHLRAAQLTRLEAKDTSKGTVIRVDEDYYLIDLGQGVSGRLPREDLVAVLKKGDHVRVKVLSSTGAWLTLSRQGIDSEKAKLDRLSKANARRLADRELRNNSKGASGANPMRGANKTGGQKDRKGGKSKRGK